MRATTTDLVLASIQRLQQQDQSEVLAERMPSLLADMMPHLTRDQRDEVAKAAISTELLATAAGR